MLEATRQLERVRWMGRAMLVAQRLFQWLAAVELTLLAAGLLDFGLRLPGWLRLLLGVGAAAVGLFWIITRLLRALAIRPDLGRLALRAEQLHPELSGRLASGVEFSLHPDRYEDTPRTAALVQASVSDLQARLRGVSLGGLLNPVPTAQRFALFALATLVVGGVAFASPQSATIAFRRWFLPLGQTQWPRRTAVRSLVDAAFSPSDAPLRMSAAVDKGYRPGMRTWVVYRFVTPANPSPTWQWALMNEQNAAAAAGPAGLSAASANPAHVPPHSTTPGTPGTPGTFERLLDLPDPIRQLTGQGDASATVDFYFEAGDDTTPVQTLALVQRPMLRAIHLLIEPPAYAHGLVGSQDVDLDQQTGQIATATALVGSQVRWVLDLNKPVPTAWLNSSDFMPGLKDVKGLRLEASTGGAQADAPASSSPKPQASGRTPRITIAFRLASSLQSPIHLVDEHGLSNLSDRLYRVEATVDQPPSVSMTLPVSDEADLATATVPLEAVAQDDVGVESVELETQTVNGPKTAAAAPAAPVAVPPTTAPASASSTRAPSPNPQAASAHVVNRSTGRTARLSVAYPLDLATMSLQPGDEVDVVGLARDVFELDGQRHEPTRSAPRRVRIIDAATLKSQVWADLDGVRHQALHLQNDQFDLTRAAATRAQPGQQEISRRVETQAGLVRSIQDRVNRNRLDDPALGQVLQHATDLLQQGTTASQAASTKLEEARREPAKAAGPRAQARQKQEEVGKAMGALAGLLDQGQDLSALATQIQQLINQMSGLTGDVRKELPLTLGKSTPQLKPEEAAKLGELADQQTSLAGAADALVKAMESTAAKNANEKDPERQANAQVLSEAAATAKRQGLTNQMQSAAQQTKSNQLSDASKSQEDAMSTLQSMLGQMGNQAEKQREVLRRQLLALADAVQKLIDQQKVQNDVLVKAADVRELDEPQSVLRQNTLAVEEQAKANKKTAAAGDLVGKAGGHQAEAITAMRQAKKEDAAGGQKLALTDLESALAELRRQTDQAGAQRKDEDRQKLQAAYEKLAKQQDGLQTKTQALIGKGNLERRERLGLIDLGHEQADIQSAVDDLRPQVGDTLLFIHLHDRIDHLAGDVVAKLRGAKAERAIPMDQGRIAESLRIMAAALAQARRDDPYNSQSPSGGGGGGGGQQSQGQLVPPAAELKLLRSLQEEVLHQTRDLAADRPATPDETDSHEHAAIELSVQQRELGSLGERLIQKLTPTPHPGDAGGTE